MFMNNDSQSQGKRVKIALFSDPKNSKFVNFLKINFLEI